MRKRAKPAVLPEGTPREQAMWLVENRFVQISRKYRTLARLPKDTIDPCRLLADCDLAETLKTKLRPETERYWRDHYRQQAQRGNPMYDAKHWMSMYSGDFDGCQITLPEEQQEVFDLYRKFGGDSWPWWFNNDRAMTCDRCTHLRYLPNQALCNATNNEIKTTGSPAPSWCPYKTGHV